MIRLLACIFLIVSIKLAHADSIPTYTKKYCIALNTSPTLKYTDQNAYAYTSIYSKKHDYWIYVNYFNRTENKRPTIKDFSWGFFYDYILTQRTFLWSYYQGEHYYDNSYNVLQISQGIGFYALNAKKCFIGINNGFIYKNIEGKSEYRYNFRIKSRFTSKHFYLETYNYFQPEFVNVQNYNFISFNTFTYRINKFFNFKAYHWLTWNNITQTPFQYVILGISLENW